GERLLTSLVFPFSSYEYGLKNVRCKFTQLGPDFPLFVLSVLVELVSAKPASMRKGTSPEMFADMRITWRAMSLFKRLGKRACTSAASPATLGAAIDVPLQVAYRPFGTVLSIPCPGAAT